MSSNRYDFKVEHSQSKCARIYLRVWSNPQQRFRLSLDTTNVWTPLQYEIIHQMSNMQMKFNLKFNLFLVSNWKFVQWTSKTETIEHISRDDNYETGHMDTDFIVIYYRKIAKKTKWKFQSWLTCDPFSSWFLLIKHIYQHSIHFQIVPICVDMDAFEDTPARTHNTQAPHIQRNTTKIWMVSFWVLVGQLVRKLF